jgi:hypothetical protein
VLQTKAYHLPSPRAAFARELIREALARREALENQRRLAHDYAAGRSDAKQLLKDLEVLNSNSWTMKTREHRRRPEIQRAGSSRTISRTGKGI